MFTEKQREIARVWRKSYPQGSAEALSSHMLFNEGELIDVPGAESLLSQIDAEAHIESAGEDVGDFSAPTAMLSPDDSAKLLGAAGVEE